jgi:hypothetical protein
MIHVLHRWTNAHGSKTNKKCEVPHSFGGNPLKKTALGFGYSGKRFRKKRKTTKNFQKKIKNVLTN